MFNLKSVKGFFLMCSTGKGKKVLTQTFQMLSLAAHDGTEQSEQPPDAWPVIRLSTSGQSLDHREPRAVSRSPGQKVRAVISGLLVSPVCAVIYESGQGFSLFPWEELLPGVCTLHVAATVL